MNFPEPKLAYLARCANGLFAFDGLVKQNMTTSTEELLEFDEGVYVSETVMAPRDGSTAEDDGYLVTFTSDVINDGSHCYVIDAANVSDGPIAKIQLPERISSGTHSTWASAADL